METIEIRYKSVTVSGSSESTGGGSGISTGFYRKYVVYTDSNGTQYYARGGPGNTGEIATEYGEYTPIIRDYDREGDDPSQIVATGEDLSSAWEDIKRAMDEIEASGTPYRPWGPNSNSTVATAIESAGLPMPATLPDYPSPGSEDRVPPDGEISGSAGGDQLQDDGAPASLGENQPLSPLVLDLDGDGVELTGQAAGTTAYFDLDADGFAERTGWVKADDGLLTLDCNGNGRIDDITELFGTNDPASSGFVTLAGLDGNADGRIDAQDARFAELRVWQDADQDGISDAGELRSLGELGIASVGLGYATVSVTSEGNRISEVGTFTRADGTTGQVADVWFANDQTDTRWRGDITIDMRAYFLPVLRGYGEVAPLSVAMTGDEALLQMVADLTFAPVAQAGTFRSQVEAILLRWAEAEGVDPASRGPNIDARILVALERFTGEGFVNSFGETDPRPAQGDFVRGIWGEFVADMSVRLLMQGPLRAALANLGHDPITGNVHGTLDTGAAAASLVAQLETSFADTAPAEERRATLTTVQGLIHALDLVASAFDPIPPDHDAQLTTALIIHAGIELPVSILRTHVVGTGIADSAGDDILVGATTGETLTGGNGQDWLIGGRGNDRLEGASGNDTYLVDRGDGQDTIYDSSGTETLRFGDDVLSSQITFS